MNLAFLFVLSGVFMGWSVGTNDAANVFGTAVGTRVVKYRTAVWLCAAFAVLGAVVNGHKVIDQLGGYAENNAVTVGMAAFLVMLVAGVTVTLMTILKFPVSTSQCLVGAILGWGLSQGMADWSKTASFFSAWVVSPMATLVICFALCFAAERFVEKRIKGLAAYDAFIKAGYIVSGIFGAYSMGANNAANATGIYLRIGIFDGPVQAINGLLRSIHIPITVTVPFFAALIGGLSIALGVLTFSKRVMLTVGEGITKLSPLTGFLVVLSCSLVVYIASLAGYTISTSQAVVGAVVGAGLAKRQRSVDMKMIGRIFVAWFGTPTIAGVACYLVGILFFR